MSHPAVHPVEAPPQHTENGGALPVPRVRMEDLPGMPGTRGGLVLRLLQSFFAVGACVIMSTTSDFPTVTAFRYLVAACGWQIIWSLSLAIVDIYAILVQRRFRSCRVVSFFAVGDGITTTLTFAAACASAGITVLIGNDLSSCAKNHCTQFESSTAMAFMTWFAAFPSFILNFWSLAAQ